MILSSWIFVVVFMLSKLVFEWFIPGVRLYTSQLRLRCISVVWRLLIRPVKNHSLCEHKNDSFSDVHALFVARKKSLCPRIIFHLYRDKSSWNSTSAVPPLLPILIDLSTAYWHTHLLGNGRASRQRLLLLCSFKLPSQVHSVKTLTTAFPPPAALWK